MKKLVISLMVMILSLSVVCNANAKDRKKAEVILADAKISYDIRDIDLKDTVIGNLKKKI